MDINHIFYCRFCEHKARTVIGHLHHFKSHRNITSYIYCGLGRCLSLFRHENSLRSHINRNHKVFCQYQVKKSTPHPPHGTGKFKCGVQYCCQEFFERATLMSHLKSHLVSGISTPCPFVANGCNRKYSSWNSLTGHVSKKHKNHAIVEPAALREPAPQNIGQDPLVEELACLGTLEEEEAEDYETRDESLVALAQFYQKIEYKHMVPASTVQLIAKEIKTLLSDMQRGFLSNISSILQDEGLPSTQISDILSKVNKHHEETDVCNVLRSVYLRKKFYENNFHFVEPQVLPLANGATYYYIPIEKTIQAAFKNKSWNFCIKTPTQSQDGVLRDFYDGETFKKNEFFQQYPTAIPLILYQDGFELVCPIGPAKNARHKLEGIYLAFGNLPADVRFKKDSIQLVALCVKSDFSREEIYGRITEDILKLQESGVNIEGVGNVKAGLAFIAGDNLGQHSLAGFLESFSRTHFFCRYCLVQRRLWLKNGGETRIFQRRTVESYDRAVQQVRVNPNTGEIKSCQGVKNDTPFNLIRGFHVCAPALPPCLGHDLCEGVIAFDLKLYIQYFVKNHWFTPEELNHEILTFNYSQEDNKDRIPLIKILKKKRLAGGAWQLYNFIRLFPLMVSKYVKDVSDPVWKLVLLLKEISQFSVSPEVHVSHLPSFHSNVNEYLVYRITVFPGVPLRPKHHYLGHECESFISFGILVKVFTLRFESKHTFFTRSWKSSNNSINILQTLSYKHEFLQSWLRSGAGITPLVEAHNRSSFLKTLYSEAIQSAVTSCPREECGSVTVKGTLYKKGDIVILRKLSCLGDVILVGVIHIILIDSHDEVKFVVRQCRASLVPKYGDFKITALPDFECVRQEDLMTYYPHHNYTVGGESYLVLRHALVNTEFDVSSL